MKLNRRDFLKLAGLAGVGVSLAEADLKTLWATIADSERNWPGPGVEQW